jgi:transcriptional repressor NrdR
MRCPFCSHFDTTVKDSRTTDDLSAVRRRRQCPECGNRFTTFERIQLRDLIVIKKDGVRVGFDRDKLARSIETALHKRPIPTDQIERMISAVIRRLETCGEIEIPSHVIGEIAIEALYNLDTVAYIRFASVYHEFQNVEDFINFISNMSKKELHL